MMKLEKRHDNLPATLEELREFVLVGEEKVKAYRAKLRAIDKVGLAQEVRKQAVHEGQIIAENVLYAEARLGELLEPLKNRANQPSHRGRMKVLPEGIDWIRSHEAQLIARNPDKIELALAEATANDDIPTRRDVLRSIAGKHRHQNCGNSGMVYWAIENLVRLDIKSPNLDTT